MHIQGRARWGRGTRTEPRQSRSDTRLSFSLPLSPPSSSSADTQHTFTAEVSDWGFSKFINVEEVLNPANGWVVNNRMILSIDITVSHEELDTGLLQTFTCCHPPLPRSLALRAAGGVPCDVTLKLPCGSEVRAIGLFLQSASPFFRDALEDMQGGTAPVPVSRMRASACLCVNVTWLCL
jgi:hypothetical protein